MNSQEILEKLRLIQSNLLEYIDKEDNIEENFQNLKKLLDDYKIAENSGFLKSFLYLLLNISNNHFRCTDFFQKIEKLLLLFKDEMIKNFSNYSIFNVFKSNKRILLFLIEQKIITIDEYICSILTSDEYEKVNYPSYFFPELQSFLAEESSQKISLQIDQYFFAKRKIGENDNYICELIRKDLLNEFLTYVKQNNYPLNSNIKPSIFDTNSFFNKKDKKLFFTENDELSLIDYAAFYGSIQIFKYLFTILQQKSPKLWTYAAHGNNIELIHFLEQKNKDSISYYMHGAINEAIKCHHNEIANYLINKFVKNKKKKSLIQKSKCLKFFNYQFIQNEMINKSLFYKFCKYDHIPFVEYILKNCKIDINEIRISNIYLYTINLFISNIICQKKFFLSNFFAHFFNGIHNLFFFKWNSDLHL